MRHLPLAVVVISDPGDGNHRSVDETGFPVGTGDTDGEHAVSGVMVPDLSRTVTVVGRARAPFEPGPKMARSLFGRAG